MEIFDVIDQLEDIVDKAFTVPILHKALMDKDDLMDLLEDIRLKLPEELKQAKWVKDERTKLITEAHQEAAGILTRAEEQIKQLVEEHEITKRAYEQANEIIQNSQKNAREIRLGARMYVDNMLEALEQRMISNVEELRAGRQELKRGGDKNDAV